ncbi:MAG TPA: tetratricopeptide repeat protein [Casimicrobiaceae bacterium]|nr:tetratricopeptide repeat protein [Casimicrobiaceae bacterium]
MEASRARPGLPTGTITFLLTDIEGSVRLWETQRAAMERALVRHDKILRGAIEAHGGHLVKSTGDGALAAFSIATDAVRACLAAQRGLSAQAWDGASIKSRMALHSGAAEQRDGDYYGPALNRAARLMAAGHGGQILLSLSTAELVRDHLPPNVTLRDMGERRLKDLIRPERVFQLTGAELHADFPPLKTLDARPNNLPAQPTPLIGREDAVRAIKEHLSRSPLRLLTLSGPGGTGKTRLALQAAAELVDEFEHGVFFVPLAALSDPDLVLPAIAQTFDVREAAGQPLRDQLGGYLREKEMLLVLDNFEQVVDAAPSVSHLLSAAPRLKALVTSREVLRLSGEADFPVRPLSLPESKPLPPLEVLAQYGAVALFVERAAAVKPGFTVTNENAPAVAEICHRLDGLPLAIELAAAHVRVLPPQRMLGELNHRLSFLMGGARDLPARQKTLRSTIDWSHDLLTTDEQKLFRRLAVFAGGCALEAVDSVCNAGEELRVLETVESLVAKSLVSETEARGESRFAMLETIREYALERLVAAGEDEQTREQHVRYFVRLAEDANARLISAEQAVSLRRLEGDYENLRAALERDLAIAGSSAGLRLCTALDRFWERRGYLSEGRQWCARVLSRVDTGDRAAERGNVLNAAGGLALAQGDLSAARTHFNESLAIRRKLNDRRGIAGSLGNLGIVAFEQGDLATGRMLVEESLGIMRELGDRLGIANKLTSLGHLAFREENYSAAWALHQEDLSIRRELADQRGIAVSLTWLGIVAHYRAEYPAAKAFMEESMALYRELGDRGGVATALENLAAVAFAVRDFAAAQALGRQSLSIHAELGEKVGIRAALDGLAAVAADSGDPLRAARVWGATERLLDEIGAPRYVQDQRDYDRRVAALRAALGEAAFDQAWRLGCSLTLEEAIAFALSESVPQQR